MHLSRQRERDKREGLRKYICGAVPVAGAAGAQRAYHAMVKPIGSICNLDCTYCYYLHKQDLLGSTNKFRISDEILETHIRQYI